MVSKSRRFVQCSITGANAFGRAEQPARSPLWNLQYPILPLVRLGSRPHQYERFNHIGQRRPLLHEKNAGTVACASRNSPK
jgi:hypothetical protein